jgi:hypothetical protein
LGDIGIRGGFVANFVSAQPAWSTDPPAQNGENSLISIDAASRCGSEDGSNIGEQVNAPARSEPAGDLSIGRSGPQLALAAIVVGRNVGMLQKGGKRRGVDVLRLAAML